MNYEAKKKKKSWFDVKTKAKGKRTRIETSWWMPAEYSKRGITRVTGNAGIWLAARGFWNEIKIHQRIDQETVDQSVQLGSAFAYTAGNRWDVGYECGAAGILSIPSALRSPLINGISCIAFPFWVHSTQWRFNWIIVSVLSSYLVRNWNFQLIFMFGIVLVWNFDCFYWFNSFLVNFSVTE